MPIDTEVLSSCTEWDSRSGEQYYIFKVDPAQKVVVAGSPTVRFFRCLKEHGQSTAGHTSQAEACTSSPESLIRPWEAEDVCQKRGIDEDGFSFPEHLAEAARRFTAWRARRTNSLFVYLMIPKKVTETEWIQLLENGFQFFDDVPWIL